MEEEYIDIHVTEVGGCIIKRLFKESEMEPTDEGGYYAQLGTMIHKTSELIMRSIIAGNGTLPFEEAIEKAGETDYDFYVVNEYEVRERAEKLYNWLEQETLTGNINRIRSTEEKMFIPLEQRVDGKQFRVTGTADLTIYHTGEKDEHGNDLVEVVDLKSGKTRSKKHAWQVSAYAHMLMKTSPRKLNVTRARIVYLGAPFEEKRYKNGKVTRKHERVLTREQIDKYYQEWVDVLYQYVDDLVEHWGDPPVPEDTNSDCYFCDYKSFCWGEY
jgi:CRISPR/Cas system-associated exonuclease Cas4 (RecB family)